ncbi:MAG: flavin-containing monooxygenase [Gammaproteobacteria bacterium]
MQSVNAAAREFDAVIVGAGFAGMYMLHRLRGLGLSVRVIEAASDVGGTWYWNRYPGARCDVQSMEYCYQFSPELLQAWNWTERFAGQPEILAYARHVAERFDLRRDIDFDTRVESAHYDAAGRCWRIRTAAGGTIAARWCVMATGCLSATNTPEFPGLEDYSGARYHTGDWPHTPVDFTGLRVGVIGTGSSGIQAIPIIAEQARHLYVFQRSPNYSVPARNRPLGQAEMDAIKADYPGFLASLRNMTYDGGNGNFGARADAGARRRVFDDQWARGSTRYLAAYDDLLIDPGVNESAAEYIRERIRETVRDPAVAALLCPDDVVGCKRICADTDYYTTFNRDNVTLVDVRAAPIETFTPAGIRTAAAEYPLDCVVFATGFDAMTGALLRMDIRGRDGLRLADEWAGGPRTYLGIGLAGFPNLFVITGPGSPSVWANVLNAIEQHVDWITGLLAHARAQGCGTVEASRQAQDAWVAHVNEVAEATLLVTCNSWYLGSNIPGKPRVFMPYLGVDNYNRRCAQIAAQGYAGFELSP